MDTHVRVLGILHIVFGVIGLFLGLAGMLMLGGIAGVAALSEGDPDAFIAVPILGAIGTFIFLIALVLSLPGIIAGTGLLKYRSWARILTIILSAIHILNFPFGTALGVYGLWVLLAPQTAARFETPARYPG
jgi:hypothetical protein